MRLQLFGSYQDAPMYGTLIRQGDGQELPLCESCERA